MGRWPESPQGPARMEKRTRARHPNYPSIIRLAAAGKVRAVSAAQHFRRTDAVIYIHHHPPAGSGAEALAGVSRCPWLPVDPGCQLEGARGWDLWAETGRDSLEESGVTFGRLWGPEVVRAVVGRGGGVQWPGLLCLPLFSTPCPLLPLALAFGSCPCFCA